MLTLETVELERLLDYAGLTDALEQAFATAASQPTRHHHTVPVPGGTDGTLLIMPAWVEGGLMGAKIVTVFPDNVDLQPPLPSVLGQYILMDATTGAPLALMDGTELTRRRTAAASALAARYLAMQDSHRLFMVGSGALAHHLVRAHAAARPISEVRVWSRDEDHAIELAAVLEAEDGLRAVATHDREDASRWADIISCATLSTKPLVHGRWLTPGTHLDLVGAFRADMRESDVEALARSRLFVDTRAGALKEGGDVVQAIEAGVITETQVLGELADLASGAMVGREHDADITCFKSVGAALEDLAAASLAYERAGDQVSRPLQ
jgi:alanine dehydrogenase